MEQGHLPPGSRPDFDTLIIWDLIVLIHEIDIGPHFTELWIKRSKHTEMSFLIIMSVSGGSLRSPSLTSASACSLNCPQLRDSACRSLTLSQHPELRIPHMA
jgi:hypothetical protein